MDDPLVDAVINKSVKEQEVRDLRGRQAEDEENIEKDQPLAVPCQREGGSRIFDN